VEKFSVIEDARGVDVSQIHHQLALSVPERVRSMVDAANTLLTIQQHARRSVERRAD
jgi:hypothetical protein